jgi:proteasome accessory factor B
VGLGAYRPDIFSSRLDATQLTDAPDPAVPLVISTRKIPKETQMSAAKSERLLNLTITLLTARGFVTKARLRKLVDGYRDYDDDPTDAAFNRTFERDKDELLALGVPLEHGPVDGHFSDEVGYRISRTAYELPAIEFTADEAAVISLAGTVWGTAAQSEQTVRALAKLRAAGLEPDPSRAQAVAPVVKAADESFEVLALALTNCQPVTFGYHGEARKVRPWALACRHGDWYLSGFDTGRDAVRLFKLSRFESPARVDGPPSSFERGEVDFAELFSRFHVEPDAEALVAVKAGRAPALRRRGRQEQRDGLPPGFDAYRIGSSQGRGFAAELCSFGADVLVLEPDDLRAQVVAQLRAVRGWAE